MTTCVKISTSEWKKIQIDLDTNPDLIDDVYKKLQLAPKVEKDLTSVEALTLYMINNGIIGYLGHLVAPPERCLELAFINKDKDLVLYYLLRRAPINKTIWQQSLLWGSWYVHNLLLTYSSIDYTTNCNNIINNLNFLNQLVDRYQIGRNLIQLNWILRLIGARLNLDDIDKLDLPDIQLRQCLKGMLTFDPVNSLQHRLGVDKVKDALARWKLKIDPYLAGMTNDSAMYNQFLDDELKQLEMVDKISNSKENDSNGKT